MNESQIERLLGTLQPVNPSAELMDRVGRDMELQSFFRSSADTPAAAAHKPSQRSWQAPVLWASAGAAAAAALVMVLMPPRATPIGNIAAVPAVKQGSTIIANPGALAPVSTNRQVVSTKDEGVIYPSANQAVRQIRVQYLEQRVLIDSATGAQTIVTVPVEEVITVPVQVQ